MIPVPGVDAFVNKLKELVNLVHMEQSKVTPSLNLVGPYDNLSIPQHSRDVLSSRNMTPTEGWKRALGPQTLWQLHDTVLTQIEKILEIR